MGVGVREIEPVGHWSQRGLWRIPRGPRVGCAGAARWRDGGGWCTALGGRLRGEHVSGASTVGARGGVGVVGAGTGASNGVG